MSVTAIIICACGCGCANGTGCLAGSPTIVTAPNGAKVGVNRLAGGLSFSFDLEAESDPLVSTPVNVATGAGSITMTGLNAHLLHQFPPSRTSIYDGTLIDAEGKIRRDAGGTVLYNTLPAGVSLTGSMATSFTFGADEPDDWTEVGEVSTEIEMDISVYGSLPNKIEFFVAFTIRKVVEYTFTNSLSETQSTTVEFTATFTTASIPTAVEDTEGSVCAGDPISLPISSADDVSIAFGAHPNTSPDLDTVNSATLTHDITFKRDTTYPAAGHCDLCPSVIVASGTFPNGATFADVRLVRVCPEPCNIMNCKWVGTGMITPDGGSPTEATFELAHSVQFLNGGEFVDPTIGNASLTNKCRLDYGYLFTSGTIHFISPSACPIGTAIIDEEEPSEGASLTLEEGELEEGEADCRGGCGDLAALICTGEDPFYDPVKAAMVKWRFRFLDIGGNSFPTVTVGTWYETDGFTAPSWQHAESGSPEWFFFLDATGCPGGTGGKLTFNEIGFWEKFVTSITDYAGVHTLENAGGGDDIVVEIECLPV